MLAWLKLSHHTHSGRLRPHEHTSYLPLGFLLIFVGFALTAYTAVASSPPPESGSIGLSGSVPAKPPTVAAVLTAPANGSRFSTSPVTFVGTCPSDTLVEIFKNNIFGGSTPCSSAGKFSIDVDLLIGKNTITAKVYDSLNQPGPTSNSLTVYYDALPPQAGPTSSLDFGGSQLLLNTDAVFRGIFPEQELSIPIDVLGGAPPYAINVQWGDTTNKVIPRNDNATFNATHMYTKPGVYQISIQASDAGGRVAFLTVASIVNGQPSIAATTGGLPAQTNKLLLLWPLYTSTVAVVVSFWLGERREKQLLNKRGLLLSQ